MDDLNNNDDMRELVEYFMDKKINPAAALKLMAKTTYFLICIITDEECEDESN